MKDYCGLAQDNTDSFDWSIKQWTPDVTGYVLGQEDNHGWWYINCAILTAC